MNDFYDLSDCQSAVEELSRAARSLAWHDTYEGSWRRFTSWCQANNQPAFPTTEKTVLLFLHAHHSRWSWAYVSGYPPYINERHTAAGFPAPCGARMAHYLKLLRQELGQRREDKVDAIRVEDAAALASYLAKPQPPGSNITRLQALGVTAEALGLTLAQVVDGKTGLGALPAHCFNVTQTEVRIAASRVLRGIVDSKRDLTSYLILVAAIEGTAQPGYPLMEAIDDRLTSAAERDGMKIQAAIYRTGLSPDAFRRPFNTIAQPDRTAIINHLDSEYRRKTRNTAYILTGVFTARRHADLARYLIQEVVRTDAYITLTTRITKTDPTGATSHSKTLTHLAPERPCPLGCPTCALGLYLDELARIKRTEGPIFGTTYAGKWGPMTAAQGTNILKALWTGAGLSADAKIATRSMRAGGATSAMESGMEIDEMASTVTNHATMSEALGYVRICAPWTLQRPLEF